MAIAACAGTLQKELTESTTAEKGICSTTLNMGDECVDRKECKNGRARYTSTSHFLFEYME